MISYGNHAGFTITSSKIQLVEVNYRDSRFFLQNVDEVYFDEHLKLLQDKETKTITVLQAAFNEILIRNHVNSKLVSFTLPPEIFYTVQLPYDNTILNQDLIEEIRWELSVLFPHIFINDLVIQYIEIEKNRLVGQNTILVSAIKRKYIHWLKYFCEENNLKIKFIDSSHFASERALTTILNFNSGLILSLYVSNNYISFIFSLDSKPFLFKVLPYSSANELPQIILRETSPTETINLNRSMIDSVYICGEDISNSFADTLSKSIDMELKVFNPFENINPDPELFENNYFSKKSNTFSPAAGIAYRRT